MRWTALVVTLAGCGRIDFDALPDASRDATPSTYAIITSTAAGTIASFSFDGVDIIEALPRPPSPAEVDVLAMHDGHIYAAGRSLTTYDLDASAALVMIGSDGGGQYALGRSRLAFHPTLPVMYMSGDDAATTNVLVYDLGSSGVPTYRNAVGDEATPSGIDVDPAGAFAYTTSGTTVATVCTHQIDNSGGLATATPCETTTSVPLALAVAPDDSALAVAGTDGVALHPLDATHMPSSQTAVPTSAAVRAAVRSPDGSALFLSLANDVVAEVDVTTGGLRDMVSVRAGTTGIAVTPDGRLLIGGDPAGVAAYDLATRVQVAAWSGDAGGTPSTIVVLVR